MRTAGLAVFVPYTGNLEGVVAWPYLDILGLTTVAIGNLCDPLAAMLTFPFVRADDGSAADVAAITSDFYALKAAWCGTKNGSAHCPWKGVKPCVAHLGHLAAKSITHVRLTAAGVQRVVLAKLASNEAIIRAMCPDYDEWPVDAQLGINSWAWAVGPAGRFPKLIAACNARDFASAARECFIDESGPDRILGTADDNWGLKPRNVANRTMFENAARAFDFKLDPDELLYDYRRAANVGATVLPPPMHAPPPQAYVPPLPEEVTGSGVIAKISPYDAGWTRPLDDA